MVLTPRPRTRPRGSRPHAPPGLQRGSRRVPGPPAPGSALSTGSFACLGGWRARSRQLGTDLHGQGSAHLPGAPGFSTVPAVLLTTCQGTFTGTSTTPATATPAPLTGGPGRSPCHPPIDELLKSRPWTHQWPLSGEICLIGCDTCLSPKRTQPLARHGTHGIGTPTSRRKPESLKS